MENLTTEKIYELALFAGGGGGILAGQILGWETVCAVELDPYRRGVLLQRQNEGYLKPFPIWDDVQTFSAKNRETAGVFRALRGVRSNLIITGGFPCTDISLAGKGKGIFGEESKMWFEQSRIIREIRPAKIALENSPALTLRGIDYVLRDLAEMGYNAVWGVLGANQFSGRHSRYRIWIYGEIPNANERRQQKQRGGFTNKRSKKSARTRSKSHIKRVSGWPAEPPLGRMVDGFSGRVAQLAALGDAQVPRVAAGAYSILSKLISPGS